MTKFFNNNIIVLFDYDWNSSLVKQHSGLFIPERYVLEEGDEDAPTANAVQTDRRLINPQTVTVVQGNEDWLNLVKETYPEPDREAILKAHPVIKPGRYFVHYGAFEVANWLDKEHHAAIPGKMILFGIDPIRCMPGTYLGEEVFGELPQTATGIYLTPQLETKEGVLVRVTHVPEDSRVNVGDTVVTIDQFQYDLWHEGKKYIKVEDSEITGVKTETGYAPFGDRVLVELLPDADLAERVAENDRRRALRDYVDHNRLHVSETYTKGLDPDYLDLPEPKLTNAIVVGVADNTGELAGGDKLLIRRNYGCRLPNNQWILSMDLILGVLCGD